MWIAEKGGQLYKNPYDLSVYENLTTVLVALHSHKLDFNDLIATM